MEEIKLKQGSKEWLKFRRSGIGGSDASAILGYNPYKSNIDLWEEKTGRKEPNGINDISAVRYGKNAEQHLTKLFALDYPQYKVINTRNIVYKDDFKFASTDGALVEIKTGRKGILEDKTTEIFGSMAKEKWNDQIPQNYFVQCLHYLLVTGWEFVKLKAQLKSTDKDGEIYLRTKHYHLESKDFLDDIVYLNTKEKEFWNCVVTNTRPNLILPQL